MIQEPARKIVTEDYVAENDELVDVATGSRTVTITLPPKDSWRVDRVGHAVGAASVRKVDPGPGVVKLVTSDGTTIDGPTTIAEPMCGYGFVTTEDGNWEHRTTVGPPSASG